jgi:hypothetical protein
MCQFHSGTCLVEMRTVPAMTDPRAGFGQTPTAMQSLTSYASIVSTYHCYIKHPDLICCYCEGNIGFLCTKTYQNMNLEFKVTS